MNIHIKFGGMRVSEENTCTSNNIGIYLLFVTLVKWRNNRAPRIESTIREGATMMCFITYYNPWHLFKVRLIMFFIFTSYFIRF